MSEALGITAFYIFIAAIIVAAVLYLEQRWSRLVLFIFKLNSKFRSNQPRKS